MAINEYFKYKPTFLVPSGETLLETIEAKGMSKAELARLSGFPVKMIDGIVRGEVAVTPNIAIEFEKILGVPASFWNNLERNYQEVLAKTGKIKSD